MTIQEAIAARHSVRSYLNRPVPGEWMEKLESEIRRCNAESGLHIQAVWEEPAAFSGFAAHYGKFTGVRNYFAMVGPKSAELEELCGYYGERLVLLAQTMGLSTCWVAGTFGKGAAKTACGFARAKNWSALSRWDTAPSREFRTAQNPWKLCANAGGRCRSGSAPAWTPRCWRPRQSISRNFR
jgi:hypothetical protein